MWRRSFQSFILVALAMLPFSGCGHGDKAPTVTEAEQKLTEQMSILVIEAERTGGKDIKMSFQNEHFFRCPKGKVRHGATFEGKIITGERKPPTQVGRLLLGITEAAGLLGKNAYDVTYVRGGDPTTKLYNAKTRTNIVLTSSGIDRMTIKGFTDCLKRK